MRILLGVTGSIAAFKAISLARLLREEGDLKVVITKGGLNFVTPLTFSTLLKCEVLTESDYWSTSGEILHISLSRWAEIIAVVPATAHFIAKWAHGLADDLLSSVLIAFNGPVVFAPAMHSEMWNSMAFQENLRRVEELGGIRVGPERGKLASGDFGIGRLTSPEKIKETIVEYWRIRKTLSGKKILIVYGRTEEDIDPVRVVTNRSSGIMGSHLVRWAKYFGAQVISIVGKVETLIPYSDELVRVRTTEEMLMATRQSFQKVDVLIMAAAPVDFRPKVKSSKKIKKKGGKPIQISLEPTPDILSSIKGYKNHRLFIGFALESNDLVRNSKKKLIEKGLDLVIANTPDAMGSNTVSGYFVTERDSQPFQSYSKSQLAKEILYWIGKKLEGQQ